MISRKGFPYRPAIQKVMVSSRADLKFADLRLKALNRRNARCWKINANIPKPYERAIMLRKKDQTITCHMFVPWKMENVTVETVSKNHNINWEVQLEVCKESGV